jgi:outer membrane protein
MKRTILVLFFAVALAFTGTTYAQKPLKIGYFNSNDLIKRMPEADSIQKLLKDYMAAFESDYALLTTEYQQLVSDYQAKASQLTEMLKSSKQREIKSAEANLQEFQRNAQDSITNKQNELMNVLIDKIKKAAGEIAKEEKYTYIIESNSILWYAEESEDITPKLVKKLNLQ